MRLALVACVFLLASGAARSSGAETERGSGVVLTGTRRQSHAAGIEDRDSAPAPRSVSASSEDARYERAHRAAVRYRRQRDDLQRRLTVRVKQVRRLERRLASHDVTPIVAIRMVFGRYADQAIRVSSCETGGTFDVNARNGQYQGIFQFGEYARAAYGFGPTALEQAQAAYRYFVAAGRDWSPWECQP